ncbi:MAG: DNA polymerase III subunit gamma/tau, partial [Burkholderiaceae bacterium]|nr:DNA polymerase III subunit gamma/tau [Burkholderiaceae bacterium]
DGQGGITATPCGVCQACVDIDSGRFVDYTELDAASNRGVDEVQALLEQAVYKPVQGRFKVFMIDEVHMLTNTAFNAMLKTLEEPPEYLKFVLATTDPQKVPVTVLSRCLQFNLRPMAPETVLEHLQRVLAAEGVPADTPALRLLARAARGSMRDALSLADQAIAFGAGKLEEASVRLMLGSVDRSHVFRLIDALARGDGKTVVDTTETLRLHGLSAASTLEEMSTVLQRMAVLQAVPPSADDPDPDAAELARLAALMPVDETQLLYSMCLHGRAELGLAPDEYAALTMVLLRLLAFKPAAGATRPPAEKKTPPEAATALLPEGHADRPGDGAAPGDATPVQALSQGAPDIPVAAAPPGRMLPVIEPPAAPAASARPGLNSPARPAALAQAGAPVMAMPVRQQSEPGPRTGPRPEPTTLRPEFAEDRSAAAVSGPRSDFTPTEEGEFWYATVRQLVKTEAVAAMVRELAVQSQLVARDTGHWMLRVERESLNHAGNREKLQNALRAAGHDVSLSVEVGTIIDCPARRNAAAAKERQRAAEEVILNDPLVQSMMRDFGAKIVPGSIKPVKNP